MSETDPRGGDLEQDLPRADGGIGKALHFHRFGSDVHEGFHGACRGNMARSLSKAAQARRPPIRRQGPSEYASGRIPKEPMSIPFLETWLAISLFFGMLLLLEWGRRFGARRLAQDPAGAHAGVGAVEGAVFGLLGLLVAFTFSGAAAGSIRAS